MARRISNSCVLLCYDRSLFCIVSRQKVEHNLTLVTHRVGFSSYELTKEELATKEAFSMQCHIPLSWIRRARIVCLLTAKPASLLPLLADYLGEVPSRSHGCNKERSGATSFKDDRLFRKPVDRTTMLQASRVRRVTVIYLQTGSK